jgi:hypothetical protein
VGAPRREKPKTLKRERLTSPSQKQQNLKKGKFQEEFTRNRENAQNPQNLQMLLKVQSRRLLNKQEERHKGRGSTKKSPSQCPLCV